MNLVFLVYIIHENNAILGSSNGFKIKNSHEMSNTLNNLQYREIGYLK